MVVPLLPLAAASLPDDLHCAQCGARGVSGRIAERGNKGAPAIRGRFTLRASPKVVAELFGLTEVPDFSPRFNIAPTQPVAVVRSRTDQLGKELVFLHWGLIPSWANDP